MKNSTKITVITALSFIILNIIFTAGASADVPAAETKTEIKTATKTETRLKFLAAGDNIIHAVMIEDAQERAKDDRNDRNEKYNLYNFKDMYVHIENIVKSADISLVNVETPVAGDEFEYTGYPNFNTPKENGFALADMFDIVNIANNHMIDKGEQGYINHINFWESQNKLLIGGFKDEQEFENVRIYNKDGVSIAFLSYTYGTNGMILPDRSKMVVPLIDKHIIERQIKQARPLADLLFIVMHWGEEDNFTPDKWQRSLAQMMIDNGVDAIIGMHPHVLQEVKWVEKPDSYGNRTLVAYSLGNFISAQLSANNMTGAFLEFDIVKTASSVYLENAQIIPVVTHYNGQRKGFQVYRLEDYPKKLAESHGCKNYDEKFSYEYLKDLVKQNIAPEFLSGFYK